MLYMPGGKQIARVHGPFVSDEEVRAVADHWRGAESTPDYVISAVTEEPAGRQRTRSRAPRPARTIRPMTQTLPQARSSWWSPNRRKLRPATLQRQLRDRLQFSAARLIERMEKDGIIGDPRPCRPARGTEGSQRAAGLNCGRAAVRNSEARFKPDRFNRPARSQPEFSMIRIPFRAFCSHDGSGNRPSPRRAVARTGPGAGSTLQRGRRR